MLIDTNSSATSNNKTMISSFLSSIKDQTENKEIENVKSTVKLDASIESISNQGVVIIAFNKKVFVIPNATNVIDENVFMIKVLAGPDSNPLNLNISYWNVTSNFFAINTI